LRAYSLALSMITFNGSGIFSKAAPYSGSRKSPKRNLKCALSSKCPKSTRTLSTPRSIIFFKDSK